MMTNITANFTWYEVTRNNQGVEIIPTEEQAANMRILITSILQPLRDKYGAIYVTSGIRDKELNDKVGGAKNSYHLKGMAMDVWAPKGLDLYNEIIEHYKFTELIYYYKGMSTPKFLHIAYDTDNPKCVIKSCYTDKKGKRHYRVVGKGKKAY